MKVASNSCGSSGPATTLTACAVELTVYRGEKAAPRTQIGEEFATLRRGWQREQLAFLALWLGGLWGVGYCLKLVLAWP